MWGFGLYNIQQNIALEAKMMSFTSWPSGKSTLIATDFPLKQKKGPQDW